MERKETKALKGRMCRNNLPYSMGGLYPPPPIEYRDLEAISVRYETDLEMALRYAVGRGIRRMRILGALGGRLDQTLANILLLTLPVLEQVEAHIVEGHQTAWLIRGADEVQGAAGDTLSLIALCRDARGVTTEGLEYPLVDATLPFGLSLGVSNVLTGQRASIVVREGLLLAIHTAGGT